MIEKQKKHFYCISFYSIVLIMEIKCARENWMDKKRFALPSFSVFYESSRSSIFYKI